jgi:hypothetical protein
MKRRLFATLMLALGLALIVSATASAHGKTQVGDYELEIGFHNEPAYLNQPNGLDLFVTNSKTGEMVNGLENTLQAEIIFGSSKKALKIEPQEGDGAYTAYVVPTQVGDYTWHIFGTIENTPVDVSMTSSPDTFGSVEPLSDYTFPGVTTASAGLGSATLTVVSVAGVVLGLLGSILGLIALLAARQRTR